MIQRTIVPGKFRDGTLWLLSVAVALAAILPSLGMVLHAGSGGLVTMEICSAQGTRFIVVAAADAGDFSLQTSTAPGKNETAPHCPLCVVPGAAPLPPSLTGSPTFPAVATVTMLAPLRDETPIPVAPRSSALSRAPPVVV